MWEGLLWICAVLCQSRVPGERETEHRRTFCSLFSTSLATMSWIPWDCEPKSTLSSVVTVGKQVTNTARRQRPVEGSHFSAHMYRSLIQGILKLKWQFLESNSSSANKDYIAHLRSFCLILVLLFCYLTARNLFILYVVQEHSNKDSNKIRYLNLLQTS